MLNLKKLIASIAAITVAFSTVAFASTYTDVAEDSAYYEAVESLSKLGIVTGYEDGTYKPEETVTRAEMAALIARIQGYEETAKGSANTVFTDVPSSHWASGYIAQASNQAIVNGYGDGTFGPEDPVLYEQAVKMIMATLGYTPFAEQNGSYPTGYLSAASRYEVTKGVSNAVIGEGANRGTIAQLLANAIDTPLMGQSKWSTNGDIEYTIYDGVDAVYKTLMSENLGVTKLKGVVTENTVTDLFAAKAIDTTKLPEVEIVITGNFDTNNKDFAYVPANAVAGTAAHYTHNGKFLVGETDAEDYLGMAVVFYVVENDVEDMYEIISIAADSTKNDTLTFTLDQFDRVEAATQNVFTTIRYYKNATDRTSAKVTINDNITTVYNNVGGAYDLEDVLYAVNADGTPSGFITGNGASKYGGQVTLVDYNGIAGYDVAFVDVAATAVVKKATEEGVAFKKGINLPNGNDLSELVIDPDDEENVVIIAKDGEAVDASTLVEWDVLSIIAYNDEGYILADVIANPVVGTVGATFTSKTSKGNVGYVIEGTKYDVAEGAYEAGGLEVGEGGTFYIDKYGKIAAFNEDTALATGVAGNYGFVTKAIVENDEIDGKTVTMQMVTANGVEVFDLATSVSYKTASNGSATIKPENATVATYDHDSDPTTAEVYNAEADADRFFGQSLKEKVIKYTTNSNGKINSITLADHDEKFEALAGFAPVANAQFDADNSKLGSTYVDADAIVFFVDGNGTGTTLGTVDTDKCQIGSVADLEDETGYTVLAIYADNKAVDNNIVVIKGGLTSASPTTNVAVITSVAVSEVDGDKVYALSYVLNGEEVSAETIAFTDLTTNYEAPGSTEAIGSVQVPTVGDVVKVKLNGAGKISGLNYVWNMTAAVRYGTAPAILAAELGTFTGNATTGEFFAAGYANNYKETSEQITLADATDTVIGTYKLSQADNVYVVDASGRTPGVKNGSSSSFKFYENLYDTTLLSTVKVDGNAVTGLLNNAAKDATWNTAVKTYTDYVFVRLYDSKVKDVVIVKGMDDVTVSGVSNTQTYNVTYDITGFTGAAVPAANTGVTVNTTVTLPSVASFVTDDTSATAAVGWSTDGTAAGAVTSPYTVTGNVTLYLY